MTEGDVKPCGQCGVIITHVKIIDTFENRNTEKLQWQTESTKKPHFKYAGPGKWKCIIPEEKAKESMEKPEPKPEVNTKVKVDGPFAEAELITRWASDRAYKMVMSEVHDYSTLSTQDKSALGQKTGMLTRCLVDTTIELMKIHGIKSNYGDD